MIALLIVLLILGLISILGIAWALYKIWSSKYKDPLPELGSRVHTGYETVASAPINDRSLSRIKVLDQLLKHSQLGANLDRNIIHAGWNISPINLILLIAILFICILTVMLLIGAPFLVAFLFAAIVGGLPYAWIYIQNERRQALLERQLPDILDFIARSMQAGHDFNSALRLAAQESPKPIGEEFQMVFDEVNFGGSIHNAMEGLSQRILCPDVRYFAIAVLINREIGGDIATLLKSVATLIRERLTFKDTIYAMTAEGRVSAIILGVMPFAVGLLIFFLRPEFISVLWTDDVGRKMFAYTLLLMTAGGLWMRHMVQIRV
jgi:tight adherence protein B